MASLFEMDLQNVKGVGPKRAELFAKLGIHSAGALLRFYPRAYEDWSSPLPIASAPLENICVIRAFVLHRPTEQRIRKGMTLYKTKVTDGVSDLSLTYFNNPYICDLLQEGKEYLFRGKLTGTLLRREMSAPDFLPADKASPIRPVYSKTEGLSNRVILSAVQNAFSLLPEQIRDPIPEAIRSRCHLLPLRESLAQIHFPQSREQMLQARRRLVFEEFLVLQLGMLGMKGRSREENRFRLVRDESEDFFRLLPFSPTNAQRRAVREALADMMGPSPMNRLVQGDVGSGKTAVAAALCYCAARAGIQSALMAPTEILARQHERSLSRFLENTGISCALLTGSVTGATRRGILEELELGKIQVLIGTQALFSESVRFQRLGLVITDEQHRFGVSQRAALAAKGEHPHLLVMSATPIPRTLALMIYGDLELSILDELPPGRQKIDTYVIDSSKRLRAFAYLQKHIDRGLQCYIICPLIEEGESDMASVEQYAQKLKSEWMPHVRVGTLHGKMKPAEKDAVMSAFAAGDLDILVSTTVVEVGVDVPNAVVMLIENAERYGLSQLHQLRGRVGRGKEKSTCILVSDAQNEETLRRLRILAESSDGFQIADEDLKLRGPGDFFGSRQHGLPALQIADMAGDLDVLREAQETARQIFSADPLLQSPDHRGLRAEVNQLFAKNGGIVFN
ncbi:MAG: ATP-dependent DNA helicase RecG [Collinsella tanakaei]|nr:MAG: ATP-dependent DNA helicase RecG [Collinsella tanakaei]